jgi:hypothetical protein
MQSVTLTLAWPVTAGTQETTITLEVQGGLDVSIEPAAESAIA